MFCFCPCQCGALKALFLSPCRVGDPNSQTLLVFHCLSIFSKRKVMLEATVVIALYVFYQLYQKKKLEDKRVLNLGPLTKIMHRKSYGN